jgi:hypothetical protein
LGTSWPLFPRSWFAYSPEALDDEPEAHFTPTPGDLDRVLDVLAWGRGLDRQQWAITRDRAARYSDAMIADKAHLPVELVRQRYRDAMDTILAAARPSAGSA